MAKIAGADARVSSHPLGSPALGDNDAVLEDTALDASEDTVVTVFDGQPDVPRVLTAKGNDANVSGDVVIVGTNLGGEAITDTITLNGATAVAGTKAFAAVTQATLPPYDTADTERVRIGTGAALGLPVELSRDSILAAFLDGVREATRPTVTFSATALELNTVTLNSALDGSAVIVDLYETY